MPSLYKPSLLRSIKLLVTTLALPISLAQLSAQQTPVTTDTKSDDDIVQMSRFTVSETKNETGYRATDTLGGTRLKTDLKDVAASISVVTTKFLRDTGATNNLTLLQYTANTEVGGVQGNFAGVGNGSSPDESWAHLRPNQNTRIRGLMAADNTRNYYSTDISWDGYNIDRVDLQRGPNSILFGLGSPAGIINVTLAEAGYADKGKVEFRFGSYGSTRFNLDFNKALIPNQLAFRFAFLDDDTQYRQDPAYNHNRRFYGAIRIDPKLLDRNGMHTKIKANFEHGEGDSNNPRMLTPVDKITPWFATGTDSNGFKNPNKGTYDGILAWSGSGSGTDYGVTQNGSPNFQPYTSGMGSLYSNIIGMVYNSNSNGSLSNYQSQGHYPSTLGAPFYSPVGITSYSGYATNADLPGQKTMGIYKDKYITDASIFDFWNKTLDGNNSKQWSGFDAANIAIEQTFFHNRLGVEFSYDNQRYHDGESTNIDSQSISVDVNRFLADGTPNPNLGRPFITGDGKYGNDTRSSSKETYRITGFGELRFSDFMKPSWITRILGHHTFTGLWSKTDNKDEFRQFARYAVEDAYGNAIQLSPDPTEDLNVHNITQGPLNLSPIVYVGPSMLNSNYTTASDLHLSNPSTVVLPSGPMPIRYFDPATSTWITKNYNVYNSDSDVDKLYYNGNKQRLKLESKALVWQGYLLDDMIIPTIGIREDRSKQYTVAAQYNQWPTSYASFDPNTQQRYTNGTNVTYDAPWWHSITGRLDAGNSNYDTTPSLPSVNNYDSGNIRSQSYGLVMHMPKWLVAKMPLRSEISLFWYQSENFQPANVHNDIYGNPLPIPRGSTTDYGFLFNTLNNKLSLKVTWYHTTIQNTDISANLPLWSLGQKVAYGTGFVRKYEAGLASMGADSRVNPWEWNWGDVWNQNPNSGNWELYNPTKKTYYPDANAAYADEQRAINAWNNDLLGNPDVQKLVKAWNMNLNSNAWQNGGNFSYSEPVNMGATCDTDAKGIEIELTATPLTGWDVTLNVAKNTAKRMNMGGSMTSFISEFSEILAGPAGDVRMWWAGSQDSVRDTFNREFMSQYGLMMLQQNNDVPELRPWRVNVVTNYTITRGGWAKGINVGGGYRWEDRIVIGYPLNDAGTGYDIDRPYKGPTESHFDFWIGYSHKITRQIDWRIQLNVRDAFSKKQLIQINCQPDGSGAAYRIPSLTTWAITNTITF